MENNYINSHAFHASDKSDKTDINGTNYTGAKKISVRQIMILFFFASVSGITRIITPESGKIMSKASWLSPFFAVLPILLLIVVLNRIIVKYPEKSLSQIIETVFGKIFGKIILFLFFIHTLFFISVFARNFAEKFISSIFPEVAPSFFIIILLMFAIFTARRNIESFARFAEFSFIIISAGFAAAFLVAVFHADPKNLYPVTYYDIMPALKSSVPVISLWSLLTFSLFIGDNIRHNTENTNDLNNRAAKPARTMTKFMLITALFNFLASVLIIGIFNAETASNMSMPYFMIFKSIKTSGLIQSLETFFIIIWAFTDFIMISYYMFILSKIFKTLFAAEKPGSFLFIIGFVILVLAYLIGENNFEVEYFYTNILSYSSIILGYIFPFILLALGKIRKLL